MFKQLNERFDELMHAYELYNANVAKSEELLLRMEEARRAPRPVPHVRPDDPAYR